MDVHPLYYDLQRYYRGSIDGRKGESWMTCPFCGKEGKHFSFSENGVYFCFFCGAKGRLETLAKKIGLQSNAVYVPPAQPVVRRQPEPPWTKQPIDRYLSHPERYARWQNYKPVSVETIQKFQFGYGSMPILGDRGWFQSKQAWLIVPLYEDGKLVGLRGRNNGEHDGPKWTSAKGTHYVLWNIENVRPGHTMWITENYVDAALLMQKYPQFDACAIGGASTWQDAWVDRVVAAQPKSVIVALDNDLAGQASGAMYAQLAAEWQEKYPNVRVPVPNGPKIANALRRAGVKAFLFEWHDKPPKYDIGQLIEKGEV